jgi:hypothetical protein
VRTRTFSRLHLHLLKWPTASIDQLQQLDCTDLGIYPKPKERCTAAAVSLFELNTNRGIWRYVLKMNGFMPSCPWSRLTDMLFDDNQSILQELGLDKGYLVEGYQASKPPAYKSSRTISA